MIIITHRWALERQQVIYIKATLHYRVTHHVGQNLPLTSKHKFRFGLTCPWPGQAKVELLFKSQREALANVMCHPV